AGRLLLKADPRASSKSIRKSFEPCPNRRCDVDKARPGSGAVSDRPGPSGALASTFVQPRHIAPRFRHADREPSSVQSKHSFAFRKREAQRCRTALRPQASSALLKRPWLSSGRGTFLRIFHLRVERRLALFDFRFDKLFDLLGFEIVVRAFGFLNDRTIGCR